MVVDVGPAVFAFIGVALFSSSELIKTKGIPKPPTLQTPPKTTDQNWRLMGPGERGSHFGLPPLPPKARKA